MKHISDEILEKFIIKPEGFDENSKNNIIQHLEKCPSCLNVHETFLSIYRDYHNINSISPDENDELLAISLLKRETHKKLSLPEPKKFSRSLIVINKIFVSLRSNKLSLIIKNFIKNHVVLSFSFGILIFTLFSYSISTIYRNITYDRKPYALVKENFLLKVYNKDGEFLWKLNIYGFPDLPLDSITTFNEHCPRLVNFEDIDNDGYKELLITGYNNKQNNQFSAESLYCFNSDGTFRWKTSPESKEFNYTPSWRKTNWVISEFFPIKTKRGFRVFVYAHDNLYAGTVFSLIDPQTGVITSSLYIAGYTLSILKIDLDKDGFDEIITGGFSTYHLPRITVLNTERFYGVGPDYYSQDKNLPKSNVPYYILLPITEFASKYINPKNLSVIVLQKNSTYNGFSAISQEYLDDKKTKLSGDLIFAFDSDLVCRHISPSTFYNENYNLFYKQGLVTKLLDNDYLEQLKNEIIYWDGDKFVKYPVKNRYSEKLFVN
jgi:hypothetical protein